MNDDAWRRCGGWIKKKLGESSFISIYKKKKSPPNLVDLYYMFLFLFISLKPVCFLSFCLATVRWFPFFFLFIMMICLVSFFFFFFNPWKQVRRRGGKGNGINEKKKDNIFLFLTQNLPNGMALCVIRIPESVYFSSLYGVVVVVLQSKLAGFTTEYSVDLDSM